MRDIGYHSLKRCCKVGDGSYPEWEQAPANVESCCVHLPI